MVGLCENLKIFRNVARFDLVDVMNLFVISQRPTNLLHRHDDVLMNVTTGERSRVIRHQETNVAVSVDHSTALPMTCFFGSHKACHTFLRTESSRFFSVLRNGKHGITRCTYKFDLIPMRGSFSTEPSTTAFVGAESFPILRFSLGHGERHAALIACTLNRYGRTWILTKRELLASGRAKLLALIAGIINERALAPSTTLFHLLFPFCYQASSVKL